MSLKKMKEGNDEKDEQGGLVRWGLFKEPPFPMTTIKGGPELLSHTT